MEKTRLLEKTVGEAYFLTVSLWEKNLSHLLPCAIVSNSVLFSNVEKAKAFQE